MTDITVRELLPAEYPLLKQFLYLAVYVPEGRPPVDPEIVDLPELRIYRDDFGRDGDCAVVAVDGAELTGAAWARLFSCQAPGYGFIEAGVPELAVSVKPEYRGKGIGTALLRELLTRLTEAGFPRVSLAVEKINPAVRLYRRLGFSVAGERGDDFVMLYQAETGLD